MSIFGYTWSYYRSIKPYQNGIELPKKVWYGLEALGCSCIVNGFIDFEISKSNIVSGMIDFMPILLIASNWGRSPARMKNIEYKYLEI